MVEEPARAAGREEEIRQIPSLFQRAAAGAGGPRRHRRRRVEQLWVLPGSLTWNLRDIAVKGHLPRSETKRVKKIFDQGFSGLAKVMVVHHNVLDGGTGRMGLARWRSAHKAARYRSGCDSLRARPL